MSTHITGKLITAGGYTEEEQIDGEAPLARVVIVMPRATLRDVASLPMYEDVAVIKVGELSQLHAEIDSLRKGSATACRELRAEVERLRSTHTLAIGSADPLTIAQLKARAERAELAADCLANLAKLLTRDDGVDPEAYWIELTPEQANLIKMAAEQRSTL